MNASVRLLLVPLLLLASAASEAHKPSDSYLTLTLPESVSVLQGRWDIALRDLDYALGLDVNQDGVITWGELKARQSAVINYALARLTVEAIAKGNRDPCSLKFAQLLVDEHVDGHYAVLRFTADCGRRPAQLVVHYGLLFDVDPTHRGLVEINANGMHQAAVLPMDAATMTVDLTAVDRWQQFRSFVSEGIWHIWKGFDHILFLLTLLFPAVVLNRGDGWQPRASLRAAVLDVVRVVTAFTLAHSLTLSLAVLGFVQLPSRFVESAIAVTVLLGALNNLWPVVRERRWIVAFVFGLIHGFGFASVLSDLGLREFNLALALVGFNSGVEVGQIAIVLFVLPVAYLVRGTTMYRRAFMPGGAVAIGAVAAYWLVARVAGANFG